MIKRAACVCAGVAVMVAALHLSIAAAEDDHESTPSVKSEDPQKVFEDLYHTYIQKYEPLYRESELASWEASTTGTDEAYSRKKAAEEALLRLHSDPEVFARLKALKEQGGVHDPVLARQLDVMYRTYLPAQGSTETQKKIIALEAEIEQIFSTHRGLVDGKEMTENDIRQILKNTHDSSAAEAAWKGYIEVGRKAEKKLHKLVELRNGLAKELGFDNYYLMSLAVQEIDPKDLETLFDQLDELTRQPYAELMKQINAQMAERFGISGDALRPWHFGDLFFQEAPGSADVDIDKVYADVDLVELATRYYRSIGIDVVDILSRSDLYERPGKNPHAFSTDIDRHGDIRVLCNMRGNLYWADTILHELGHGVYDKYMRDELPFVLRDAPHGVTTEGVAIMFGNMARSADWLAKVRGLDPAEAKAVVDAAQHSLRIEKLIFSRWCQVMVRFERAMYENGDQDLSRLWWDLKKKYQLLPLPDDPSLPGYAAKVHVLTVPVYYHSYMMGDLFATQLHAFIGRKVLKLDDPFKTSFYGRPEVGEFLRKEVFGPGNLYSWNELTRRATGEPLNARAFVEAYID